MKVKIKCPDASVIGICRRCPVHCKNGIIEAELVGDKLQYIIETSIPVRVWKKSIKAIVKQQRAEFVKDLEELKNWIESMENPENEKAYIEDIDRLIAKYEGGKQ